MPDESDPRRGLPLFGRAAVDRRPSLFGIPTGFGREQQGREDKIYAAFGRFIAAYAPAESGFHILARTLSMLPEAKARIIFSGMRLNDIIERIRALSKPDDMKELEKFISQVNIIWTVRDRLVHRYVRVTLDGELISEAPPVGSGAPTTGDPRVEFG
jgi:hypothetical protein